MNTNVIAHLLAAASLTALLASPAPAAGNPNAVQPVGRDAEAPAQPQAEPQNRENAAAPQPPKLTEAGQQAQQLIFDAAHLHRVTTPSDIYYSYRVSVAEEEYGMAFDDSVRLKVTQDGGDTRTATLYMFTGDRRRDPIAFEKRLTNPVILMFLEQDLWHMRQRIGGRAEYFKARIAAALREHVEVEEVTATVGGRAVPVTKLTIKPFLNDPNAERLRAYRTKTYEFLFSDDVPGEVVELRTAVHDPAVAEKLLVEERLAYQRVESGS